MKIKQVEIINFRNIKHNVLDFAKLISIITGANNIGKSNSLNAIHWVITNTLLTDKWGVGENDLDSIVPKDYKKGEHTVVTLTFEDGSTFTKLLKTNPKGGHYTEYQINNAVIDNAGAFQEYLFEKFNFTPSLKCKREVNELRVMVDPLYALQKLDAKQLRMLLIDLGCSVSNEEVFGKYAKFQILRNYETKYMNDFTRMRQDLKQQRIELNKQLESLENTLLGYADVEEYNSTERESLEAKRDDLVVKIRNLRKGDSSLTSELELQIQKLEADKNLYVTEEKAKISQKLALLNQELKLAKDEAKESVNKQLNALNERLKEKNSTMMSLQTTIGAYQSTREEKKQQVLNIKAQAEDKQKRIELNNARYDEISKREFKGYVTCPDCGKIFAPDEAALLLFNKQKQDDLQHIMDENSRLEIEIVEAQKNYELNLTLGRNAKSNQEEAQKQLETLEEEIGEINNKILSLSTQPVDLSKVNEIQAQIDAVDSNIDTTKYDTQLQELETKKDDLVINQAQANMAEIEKLETELSPIKEAIENEYMKQSKYASKLEFEAKKQDVAKALNDIESLIEIVIDFIRTKIALMNDKAKEITGIDFVMLEENISNDGIKEVCYATVDGVEFGNVNTSQKLEVGIKFIHRIKEILGSNDLPILADRLEGFDDIEKIRNLTTEQMICTVVGNKEQKEIVII